MVASIIMYSLSESLANSLNIRSKTPLFAHRLKRSADMTFAAGQKILDPLPLIVSQSKALHGSALREADRP